MLYVRQEPVRVGKSFWSGMKRVGVEYDRAKKRISRVKECILGLKFVAFEDVLD